MWTQDGQHTSWTFPLCCISNKLIFRIGSFHVWVHLLPLSVSNPPQKDSILQPLLFHVVRLHQTQPTGEFKHLNHCKSRVSRTGGWGETEVQIFSRTPHFHRRIQTGRTAGSLGVNIKFSHQVFYPISYFPMHLNCRSSHICGWRRGPQLLQNQGAV